MTQVVWLSILGWCMLGALMLWQSISFDERRTILELLRDFGELTGRELVRNGGAKRSTVHLHLSKLVEEGLVASRMVGAGRWGGPQYVWRLTSDGKRAINGRG